MGIELKENEVSYSDTKIELNFGGLEEFVSADCISCFRTDIYLSDVDLNEVSQIAREQIVIVLKNHMFENSFKTGRYIVKNEISTAEPFVNVELITLNGLPTAVEVISGTIEYAGAYPQVSLELDLRLSNGETLSGSYSKEIKLFKYLF